LSRKTAKTYRLLSEPVWEYAARAGTTTPFSTGATITTDQANFDGNYTYGGSAKGQYRLRAVEVGSFRPNAFGLHDMHGNVWEWVQDCHHFNSNESADIFGSAAKPSKCVSRVLRGGSWEDSPPGLRSALRNGNLPQDRSKIVGFRVERELE
jgi:formylglycine-generating enzyme required for sulfatase activity